MLSSKVITTHRTTSEGDGRVASITLFVLITIVAGSFLYAYRVTWPRDNLVAYVPADATAYVHFRTLHDVSRDDGYALFDIPAGLTPDEAASFRTVEADGDGRWTTILAWDDIDSITASERATLAETPASWIDEKTLVVENDGVDNASSLLANRISGASLDAGAISNGLRQMRSVAPVQGYLKSLSLPDEAPPTPAIFGTVFDEGRSSMTLIMPLENVPDERPLLGLGVRSGASLRQRGAGRLLALPDAATVQHRFSGEPAAPSMLIDGLADAIENYGSPADTSIKTAAGDLFALLRPPFVLSVDPEQNNVVLHLPNIAPELLMAGIDRFLAATFPQKKDLTLPDGTTVHEFYREASPPSVFVAAGYNQVWPLRIDPKNPSGLTLFVAPDDAEGAVLATSEAALAAIAPTEPKESSARCQTAAGFARETIAIEDVEALTEETDLFAADPITRLGLKRAVFLTIGETMAVVCGYQNKLVDK